MDAGQKKSIETDRQGKRSNGLIITSQPQNSHPGRSAFLKIDKPQKLKIWDE